MTTWHSDDLDLPAYLARIGVTGEPSPTLDTLAALHRGHTTSIPFENLEIMLGRGIPLDLESLQRKLIGSRRGGYCFEHVTVFAAALERIGFRFTALSGRVTLGGDWSSRPPTHAVIVVESGGRRYLCDVGFGRGPLEPIELVDGTDVDQDCWRLRLTSEPVGDVFGTDRWILWQRVGDDWVDRHTFTANPQFPIDYRVGSHFVSTSPRSPFTTRPFVQRFAADAHHTLDDSTLTTAAPDGTQTSREVPVDELPTLLRDVFDIDLTDADGRSLVASETLRRGSDRP
ncbi:arylamine N-acetyltransferase [Gordonia sp. HY002]|uniref:arylamine N-acetyltransferase family protein n=1 Tax=Gordonia zhenghanii TaxID=2911516 RepID=UPI001EEFAC8C|nr:arylamine N-acetyltransferase [Gordonia zhenghanii]MCF8569128.1 arylamine N-acetyltransferase [Gordonia zhenghanii]MCF8603447.1 arylamine N-acetyltransferase [Gordonia zhenghanii]